MNTFREKNEKEIFQRSVVIMISFVAFLWTIMALSWALEYDLKYLGILPRTIKGTVGILTSPLIHGDVFHLLSNTIPLIILGITLFYFYFKIAPEVMIWIYLTTGFWVWLMARDAYHIGASGLVYGMAAFLFFSGIFRRNYRLLTVTLIVLFLYGGMIYGLFPNPGQPQVSWESHLLGGICGIVLAFYFRKYKVIDDYVDMGDDEDDAEKTVQAPPAPSYFSKPSTTGSVEFEYQFLKGRSKGKKRKANN